MADIRIINPTHANPCTVRQMTDEERAQYGPPAPVPLRIQMMRKNAKKRTELGITNAWNEGMCMSSFDQTNNNPQEAKTMKSNTKGKRIDRVRMHELFLEHGGGRAAAKKIAGELGCNWQTVLRAIKDEGWQANLDVEATPTVITHVTPADGPIPEMTTTDPETVVTELTIDTVDADGQPVKKTFRTVEEIEADMAVDAIRIDGMKAAAASAPHIPKWPYEDDQILPVRGPEPDAAYFSALDDLAAMYNNEPEFRKHAMRLIAKEGLRGLRSLLADKNDALWDALAENSTPSGVELSSLLMQIANAAVQGLMFLDTLEEW